MERDEQDDCYIPLRLASTVLHFCMESVQYQQHLSIQGNITIIADDKAIITNINESFQVTGASRHEQYLEIQRRLSQDSGDPADRHTPKTLAYFSNPCTLKQRKLSPLPSHDMQKIYTDPRQRDANRDSVVSATSTEAVESSQAGPEQTDRANYKTSVESSPKGARSLPRSARQTPDSAAGPDNPHSIPTPQPAHGPENRINTPGIGTASRQIAATPDSMVDVPTSSGQTSQPPATPEQRPSINPQPINMSQANSKLDQDFVLPQDVVIKLELDTDEPSMSTAMQSRVGNYGRSRSFVRSQGSPPEVSTSTGSKLSALPTLDTPPLPMSTEPNPAPGFMLPNMFMLPTPEANNPFASLANTLGNVQSQALPPEGMAVARNQSAWPAIAPNPITNFPATMGGFYPQQWPGPTTVAMTTPSSAPVIQLSGMVNPLCQICSKTFSSPEELAQHVKTHLPQSTAEFSCEVCGKRFKSNETLQEHRTTHTGGRIFSCELCSETFAIEQLYVRHRLVAHRNTRPLGAPLKAFVCKDCGKSYKNSMSLTVHRRLHKGPAILNKYKCDICGQQCLDTFRLKVHRQRHSNLKPYSCHVCGKAYKDKQTLKYHVRTHTGEKPIICDLCGQGFVSTPSLHNHMKTCHKQNFVTE